MIGNLFEIAIYLGAEFEALLSKPNDRLHLRRAYLKCFKVKHGISLLAGRGFRLLCAGNLVQGECCALGDRLRIINHATILIGDDFISSAGFHCRLAAMIRSR